MNLIPKSLSKKASKYYDLIMPGYTHMQIAQPVTFGHHLLAYVEMLDRDKNRFKDSLKRINQSPLGAAALAGTTFPIDRKMTAKTLGFTNPMANSIDAVSARDFIIEPLDASSIKVRSPKDPAQKVAFVSLLENIEIEPARPKAKVIVNARTGTIVIGGDVRVTPAVVTHGSMTVRVNEDQTVNQNNNLAMTFFLRHQTFLKTIREQ